ncbi:metal ABC transporter solute-binding protein, Zn/Mn family [Agaribacterium sp. ZY112]|uniref:metal ABC transporter solute-binding protein, Zn/Mn family n=1 Tax=Agaribacterium sp. ZY112 TaxID=3233574 RepID=UPI003525A3AC
MSFCASADVVNSIHPLELITNDLLPEGLVSTSLLGPTDSPHYYALKPQDLVTLKQAKLFIWIGPGLEALLSKAVTQQVDRSNLLTLSDALGAELEQSTHGDHHKHDHGPAGHLWLSFSYGADIARLIALRLQAIYPEYSRQIEKRLEQLLLNLNTERQVAIHAYQQSPLEFVAFHDAWAYYLEETGLKQRLAIAALPDQQLSLRRLYELKSQMDGVSCMVADINEQKAAFKLAERLELALVELDLMGQKMTEAAKLEEFLYVRYFQALRAGFTDCLNSNT